MEDKSKNRSKSLDNLVNTSKRISENNDKSGSANINAESNNNLFSDFSYTVFIAEFRQIYNFRKQAFDFLKYFLIWWNALVFATVVSAGLFNLFERSFLSNEVLISLLAADSISNLISIVLKFIFSSETITR